MRMNFSLLKKTFLLFLAVFVLALSPVSLAVQPAVAKPCPVASDCQPCVKPIPCPLEKDIREAIDSLYGKEKENEVYNKILQIIQKKKSERTLDLISEDIKRDSDWYKDEIVYMFYPEQFGVDNQNNPNTFADLIGMLDYLKDLGVTTIYILPFTDSPMGDAGFDVRDPKTVRADLGGTKEFKEFAVAARQKGFKIKADLILNHFSDQHEWFQQALKGDIDKLHYFVATDKMPEYRQYRDESIGIVVEYKEPNGLISKRRLIFPDNCENNYRKVTIKGKDYYVYHTFYPFQLDVNWQNPEVMYYMLDVIGYWANLGVDIFRLDAIPYFIKKPGTNAENLPETHETVKLLSAFVQAVAPKSVIQAEACQWPKDILPYFGKEHTFNVNRCKRLTRTDEVQVAYNFPYMPAIWASLITGDKEHFWKAYDSTPQIPDTATWAVFLRVHDELTLEMVDIATRKIIYDNLVSKGAEFRKGFGVSGRMANFLDKDPKKIGLAFSILLSLPGIPIIYYGDEIAALNNWSYAKEFAKQREETQKAKGDKDLHVLSYFDSRDINRGPVQKSALLDAKSGKCGLSSKVYKIAKNLIRARKENIAMTRGSMQEVKNNKENVFSYLRETDSQKVLIVNNLSAKSVETVVDLPVCTAKTDTKKYVKDLISNKNICIKIKGNQLELKLKPYQSLWLNL